MLPNRCWSDVGPDAIRFTYIRGRDVRYSSRVFTCRRSGRTTAWPWRGIPGMRLERVVGWHTVLLRHLPTGASLEVTELSQPKVPKPTGRLIRHRDMLMVDQPVTPAEQRKLENIPPMSGAARRLLGALAMRSTLRDPAGGWHVNWCHNTLGRPRGRRHEAERRLWGRDDLWFLEWTSYPYPQDLVASMTHPMGGLDGVAARQAGSTWILTYKRAQLHLCDREAPLW